MDTAQTISELDSANGWNKLSALWGQLKKWRQPIAQAVFALMLVLLVYWGWQNRALFIDVLAQLGALKFLVLVVWINLAYFFGLAAFAQLIRSLGYRFTLMEGFHALNISQAASLLPGGIWGIAGLVGWLWSRGLSKQDGALAVTLNMLFSLGACALFGWIALTATLGWQYAVLVLLPLAGWIVGRDALQKLVSTVLPNRPVLPSIRAGLQVIGLGLLAWVIEAACFTWLIFDQNAPLNVSPLYVASAYAAGYLVGYLVLIAPGGLGVREGVLIALLGNSIGADRVLALALTFRLAQTTAQWLNIFISWLLRFGMQRVQA